MKKLTFIILFAGLLYGGCKKKTTTPINTPIVATEKIIEIKTSFGTMLYVVI